MNLIQFIRLLIRNIKIVLIVPTLMAISTWYFTKDSSKEYLASTLVYTGLASGFNIESTGTARWDNYAINNAFDNLINTIKSRETLKEVSFRLMAFHLTYSPTEQKRWISSTSLVKLNKLIPTATKSTWVVKNSPEATYQNILKAYQTNDYTIHQIFHGNAPYYSLQALGQISSVRKGASDMIEISYKSDDRGICEQTLKILVEVFARRYKTLKVSETGDVVAYFENQLKKAKAKLSGAEDNLKEFREKGRILNYYEQTKFIAGKKEDITDEFRRLTGEVNASQAVIGELENKLQIDREFFYKNNNLLNQKNRLAELTASIALQEVNNTDETNLNLMKKEATRIESDLQKNVLDLYGKTHSTEGVPIKNLLNEWLDNVIILEKSKARANILEKRLGEIDRQYDEFAPLGSGLSRLEREINVHERAYIEILHGLNLALLRQQNIEMSSNLEVVDSPSTLDLGSKRMMLVILSFLVGWIGCVSIIVGREILDTTIKTPERAIRFTGLKLGGAFPLSEDVQRIAKSDIAEVLTNQLWANIKINTSKSLTQNPKLIAFASTQEREGKSIVMESLVNKMRQADTKVLQINSANSSSLQNHPDDIEYSISAKLLEINHLQDLFPTTIDMTQYDYILLEVPALLSAKIPTTILKEVDITLLTLRANRSWSETDGYLVKQLTQLSGKKPLVLLNGVKFQNLEGLIGTTGQKPNSIRTRIKRWIRFEFNNRNFKVWKRK
jgi:capsular polysaccharide biosynthesis protein